MTLPMLSTRLRYVRLVSKKLAKRRVVLPLTLITLIVILITLLYLPVSTRRAKTKIIFMNEELCVSSALNNQHQRTVVIVVPSTREHFGRRNVIRQTYGSVKNANNVAILGVIFMLSSGSGQQADDVDDVDDVDYRLMAEAAHFGDMVMGDFVDSYRNLTLKTIMAYDWLTSYCRQAQFVVKTDDDTVANIFELTEYLQSLPPAEVWSSNIWGTVHQEERTINDVSSQYYASPVDFPTGIFPIHCSGNGYVTTFVVIERLVEDISKSYLGRVCTHEDVFMTAIVPMHINSNLESYMWRKTEPIKLVHIKTINSVFQDGSEDQDHFLRDFVKNRTMDAESKNLITFRERYRKQFFFLISHTEELEQIHLRLWEIIKQSYSTYEQFVYSLTAGTN